MLRQISNLLEIMSIFVCIHRLYGRRVKANIGIAAAYLGCLVIYCVMDIYGSRIILTLMSIWQLAFTVFIARRIP